MKCNLQHSYTNMNVDLYQTSNNIHYKRCETTYNEKLKELIDKILVHQQTKVDGKKYQQIDIYYSGVGIILVSANEYDFESEFQNMLKNNRKTA